MKKVLKWITVIGGALLVLLMIVGVALMMAGNARINRTHTIAAEPVTIPTNEEALARGEHLVNALCTDCHGNDLGGQAMFEDPMLGTIYATNITGAGDRHNETELVIAIRHGMAANGRHLMMMPSDFFVHLSVDDLGAIIAYLKTVPQTGTEQPASEIAPIGRILVGTGAMEMLFPATVTDHDLPFPAMPKIAADRSYGEYLAQGCQGCHGVGFVGQMMPGPGAPEAPNLTPAGALSDWTEDAFVTAMRTGVTPSGQKLDPMNMPWPSYAKLGDDELRALWLYLSSLES